MINFGTIGTSWITKAFINASKMTDNLKLYCVYSRNQATADAFASEYGVGVTYTDVEAMANDKELDAVYIASPNYLHINHAEMFLKNKKHVICEKPLATDSESVTRLVALAKENNVVFMEAIKSMFTPGAEIIRDAITKIGRIYQADFSFLQLSSKYPALAAGEVPNIFNPELQTGALMDIGVYCVYPALNIFGEYNAVTAKAVKHKNGIDLCGSALLDYDDINVSLRYSKVGNQRSPSQIIGDKGTVTIESISNMAGITIYDNDGNATRLYDFEKGKNYMEYEARFFENAILNNADVSYYNELSVKVCSCLKDIRKAVNMIF